MKRRGAKEEPTVVGELRFDLAGATEKKRGEEERGEDKRGLGQNRVHWMALYSNGLSGRIGASVVNLLT